jgi:hypothetical protein
MIMEPAWAGPVVELVSGYAARRIRLSADGHQFHRPSRITVHGTRTVRTMNVSISTPSTSPPDIADLVAARAPAADQGEHRERAGQHQPDWRLARAQMGIL